MKKLDEKISFLEKITTLNPGADIVEIDNFLKRCRAELFVSPPAEYVSFLEKHNGAAENGVFLYSTRRLPFVDCSGENNDFVEMNLNWRDLDWMNGYLVFGDSDMDIYVLELATGLYQVRDRQAFDNVFNEFLSFNEMLIYMVDLMIAA